MTDYAPWPAPTTEVAQDIDLWVPTSGASPVKSVGLSPLPGDGLAVALAQYVDTQGSCQWVALDAACGCASAWLFVNGEKRRVEHGVSTFVGKNSKVQILPMSHDRTSHARLIWTDAPLRLPLPCARQLTRAMTPGGGPFATDAQCFSVAVPAIPSRLYIAAVGSAAGNLVINYLADNGTIVDVTNVFITQPITGTPNMDVYTIACAGSEVLAVYCDVATQLRIRWGVRT